MSIIAKIKSRFTVAGLKAPARWAAATGFTAVHIMVLALVLNIATMDVLGWLVPPLIVLPGVISMTLLPGGWKRWYRWGAMLGLVLMVLDSPSSNPFVVILFGETWMLHRGWVTERRIPVKSLFRRGKVQEPVSAPGRKPKGSRRPKTA